MTENYGFSKLTFDFRENASFYNKKYLSLQFFICSSSEKVWKISNKTPAEESFYYEMVALNSQPSTLLK